jgi:hypothetical protein
MSGDHTADEYWTVEGADRLRAAAAALAAAIAEHVEAVCAVQGRGEFDAVFDASNRLLEVAAEYGLAQADYTGYGFPLVALTQFLDNDEDDEASSDDEQAGPTAGVSVLSRRDYEVVDHDAVMQAGREAYLRVWPDDDEDAAAADVTHLGRALYQIAHADGWDNIGSAPGLAPFVGVTLVHRLDELPEPDPDNWQDEEFFEMGSAELLYRQDDVYRR